jgi:hypothetical protein
MEKTLKLTVGLFGVILLLALPGCKSDTGGGGTAPTITTASLPDGKVGDAYSRTLAATGDKPITWSIVSESGDLPADLSLDPTTGTISGTPTEDGTFSFTVKATNAAGSVTRPLSITIDPAVKIITDYFLPHGVVGSAYNHTLEADGDEPITWSITQGILPPGLILDPTTGDITGTPTMANRYTIFVKAVNAAGEDTKELLIIIDPPIGSGTRPTITTNSLPNGTVGVAYNQTLAATGDQPIRWSFLSGTWPVGLEFAVEDDTSGEITGTPTVANTYTFTLKAQNAAGADTKEYTITIAPAGSGGGTRPSITTASLPGGTVGVAYSQTLAATGDATITWSIESGGNLPGGLTLTGNTISGTPTTADTFTFTVKAQNAAGSDTKELSITIASGGGGGTAPTITTASLSGGTVGAAYSQTLAATGDAPITWSIDSGTWPMGLFLAPTTGTITGIPTTAGTSTFTVKATNDAGNITKQLSITIAPGASTNVNEVAGKSYYIGSFRTVFNADLSFEESLWGYESGAEDWDSRTKGTYVFNAPEKTVTTTVTHSWENGAWKTQSEADYVTRFVTQVYMYAITSDGSLLAQKVFTNTGTDELKGETYVLPPVAIGANINYTFDATGNTYSFTRSGVTTTGIYYFDSTSTPKTACLRPIVIGGKTIVEYCADADPSDYWEHLTVEADIKAALANRAFETQELTYDPATKRLARKTSL